MVSFLAIRIFIITRIYLIDLIYMKHVLSNSITSLFLNNTPAVALVLFKFNYIEYFTKKNVHSEMINQKTRGFLSLYSSKRPCLMCFTNFLYKTYSKNRLIYSNLKLNLNSSYKLNNFSIHKNFIYFLTQHILKVNSSFIFKFFFKFIRKKSL
ncbi:hypothetical protein E5P55_01355 [Candidatus Pinguicoccus supinus]|uniref:Uncharacterized protein n=1 Tax=Candidatus Pinguicoccus supinus TaxID=2529394 RepID=A0A7T0BRL8_9BACT|nr:hypothetical protein E5P55_01355 [Candidatus Pinguicoccus supinus]